MSHIQNLQKRPHGIYYLRVTIPADLVERFGCKEITRSLETKRLSRAQRLATLIKVETWKVFSMARNDTKLTQDELKAVARRFFEKTLAQAEADRLSQSLKKNEAQHILDHIAEMESNLDRWIGQNQLSQASEQIDEISQTEGISLDQDSEEYRQLAHYVLRALKDIQTILYDRTAGDFDSGPRDSLFQEEPLSAPPPKNHPSGTSICLDELIKRFLNEHKDVWKPKTLEKYTANLDFARQTLNGQIPVASIERSHIREVKEILQKLPADWAKKYPDMSSHEAASRSERAGENPMKPGSANAYLGTLSSLFSWADKQGFYEGNPASGLRVPDPVRAEDKRHPFQIDHLQTIFHAPIYTGMKSERLWDQSGETIVKNYRYWLPLVALFTGMRLGEITGLKPQHIKETSDSHVIEVVAAKTKAGIRIVPIHPILLDCGFLAHIAAMEGKEDVFEGASPKPFSKHFRRFLNSLKISDPHLVFHSFRHTFTDELRAARIEEPVAKALLGHSDGSVTSQYGRGYPVEVLSEAVAKIRYDGLDLAHLMKP
ncbi:MAG: site-specific integrase [Alphaproteobacteria bacterium]|nr:site-specific integrase [Alphaproteobacteria bacterium]